MTTKLAGGKITGLLALTMEAQAALEIGDCVHVTGPYEVNLADGTKPVLGIVSVANKKRTGSTFPAANTPGDCTVEVRGYYVAKVQAGAGGITAGTLVKPDGTGRKFVTAAADVNGVFSVAAVGIALSTAAANAYADVLFQ